MNVLIYSDTALDISHKSKQNKPHSNTNEPQVFSTVSLDWNRTEMSYIVALI